MHTHALLPRDMPDNRLLGRLWDPESQGPRLVTVRSGWLHDISALAPTLSTLLERDDLTAPFVQAVAWTKLAWTDA